MLSVNGGVFGHCGDDAEDMRGFEAAARALRPGGRLLMQVPCLPHVEQRLPPRTWFTTGETMELIEELAAIFERVGLRLLDVYDEHGKRCTPTTAQRELYGGGGALRLA